MLDDVKKRLEALGFTVTDADTWVLQFCCDKVTNHILNNCNLSVVPDGLREIAIDLACGEYLNGKYNAGQLEYETAVKNIKLGDTSVDFGGSDADLIKNLINSLIGREIDFAAYRTFKW